MTPNLKRLFHDKRTAPNPVPASYTLGDLFHAHSEALIEALEEASVQLEHITVENAGVRYNAYKEGAPLHPDVQKCCENITQLLAQLEREAHP